MLTKTRIKMSNQPVIKYNPLFKKANLVKVKLKAITPKAEELTAQFDIYRIKTLLSVCV